MIVSIFVLSVLLYMWFGLKVRLGAAVCCRNRDENIRSVSHDRDKTRIGPL